MRGEVDSIDERIHWVDALKVIGMFLVVWGHFLNGSLIKVLIYSFHVPLFFFLSGFLCSKQIDRAKRTKVLLYPYLGWTLVSLVPVILKKYFIDKNSILDVVCNGIYGIIPLNGFSCWNQPLWFLWTLCVVQIFFPSLSELVESYRHKKMNVRQLLVLLYLVVSICIDMSIGGYNLLAYRQSLLGWFFVLLGQFSYKLDLINYIVKIPLVLMVFILLPIWGIVAYSNGVISIWGWQIERLSSLFLTSIIMISFLLYIFSKIQFFRSKYWKLISKNNIFILCSHYFLLRIILPSCESSVLCSFLYAIVAYACCLVCGLSFQRLKWFMFQGREKKWNLVNDRTDL